MGERRGEEKLLLGECAQAQKVKDGMRPTSQVLRIIMISLIRWLGRLGRCVGTSYHASFCCCYTVSSGCVLGHFIVIMNVHLHLHDVVVVTLV